MRLAISAFPGLGIVTAVTAGLALAPQPQPTMPPLPDLPQEHAPAEYDIHVPPACAEAHALRVIGQVTGGASHVRLAGPVLFTDVTTDEAGRFDLEIPIADGSICSVLREPATFSFSDGAMRVDYRVTFAR